MHYNIPYVHTLHNLRQAQHRFSSFLLLWRAASAQTRQRERFCIGERTIVVWWWTHFLPTWTFLAVCNICVKTRTTNSNNHIHTTSSTQRTKNCIPFWFAYVCVCVCTCANFPPLIISSLSFVVIIIVSRLAVGCSLENSTIREARNNQPKELSNRTKEAGKYIYCCDQSSRCRWRCTTFTPNSWRNRLRIRWRPLRQRATRIWWEVSGGNKYNWLIVINLMHGIGRYNWCFYSKLIVQNDTIVLFLNCFFK